MLLIMGVPFQLSCSHVLNSIQPALASGVSNNRNFFIYQLPGFLTRWKTVHNLPANAGVQFSSVTQSYPALCNPMNRSMTGLPAITNSEGSLQPLSIESVMPSNYLILCRRLLLLPSIFPSIRVLSNELALCIRWPNY